MNKNDFLFCLINYILLLNFSKCDIINLNVKKCNLSKQIKDEITSYAPIVNEIINATINGEYKGSTYNHLADIIDKFGNRMAGSENLENAIDYILNKSKECNLENVHGEEAEIPHWVRGKESATMITPRHQPLAMLGLGTSIGTPPGGIRAEALVVASFDELKNVSHKAIGKIVVFNQEFQSYKKTVAYRKYGASFASTFGAVATLIRSVTPFSLYTPHAGGQIYQENATKIPTASITVEDANMLHRLYKKGKKIIIELKMEAVMKPPAISRNTIAEIIGSSRPAKTVIISGHFDSWDVGQGAMDDGGGAFISWNSLVLLKGLGLRARRTIRTILWTAEESNIIGSLVYFNNHRNETDDVNFIMESDDGTFTPTGIRYTGTEEVGCVLQEILKLLEAMNTTQVSQPGDSPDSQYWLKLGIPGAALLNNNEKYLYYHHTAADTLDVMNSDDLDKCTALWATVAYIIADLSFDLPRTKN